MMKGECMYVCLLVGVGGRGGSGRGREEGGEWQGKGGGRGGSGREREEGGGGGVNHSDLY